MKAATQTAKAEALSIKVEKSLKPPRGGFFYECIATSRQCCFSVARQGGAAII
jgi:hypothetical protein